MALTKNGWRLLFHPMIIDQLRRLGAAADRARATDPKHAANNANVRLHAAIAKLVLDVVPADPGHPGYRLGNTMGPSNRHWRRAEFAGRYRLFFRFDSRSRVIVYAWVNDTGSLRKAGSRNDPYVVFQKMLASGNPPDDWPTLVHSAGDLPEDRLGRTT